MKNEKRILKHFIAAVCLLFISSSCILFVPVAYGKSNATLACSAMFWMSLIIGYILIFLIHRKRKRSNHKKIAIITFFRNPPAKAADIVFLASTVLAIILSILKIQLGYSQYIIFFVVIFSFHMHSLFNSDTYKIIQSEVRRDKG